MPSFTKWRHSGRDRKWQTHAPDSQTYTYLYDCLSRITEVKTKAGDIQKNFKMKESKGDKYEFRKIY